MSYSFAGDIEGEGGARSGGRRGGVGAVEEPRDTGGVAARK